MALYNQLSKNIKHVGKRLRISSLLWIRLLFVVVKMEHKPDLFKVQLSCENCSSTTSNKTQPIRARNQSAMGLIKFEPGNKQAN